MKTEIKARLGWIKLYQETSNICFVSRRCGISRQSLHKWIKRYYEQGIDGLNDQSNKPKNSPNLKLSEDTITLIIKMREERNIGARRIQNELIRHHSLKLSLASIHKALKNKGFKPLVKIKRHKKYNHFSRPIPGDRVQVDTCKIANNIFQYTTIDDCTRFRVLEIYKKKNAINTLDFIDKTIEQFPFPIQRVQTDRGTEFFAADVEEKLMDNCIKLTSIQYKK